MSGRGRPPVSIAPERLFRSLLPLRPEARIDYRIRCAPSIPLLVRAIPAHEEDAAIDAALDAPEEICGSRAQLEIVARYLWTPSGRAFEDADAVGQLDDDEVGMLADAVAEAVGRIAPTYARSDADAWGKALEAGARVLSNIGTCLALASCVDVTPGGRIGRPDRFWGCPTGQLLDGHWMLLRAAQRALESFKS